MASPDCGRLAVSVISMSLVLLAATLGVASLFAGPWVEASFPNVNEKGDNFTSFFGFGPSGLYFDPGNDEPSTLTPVSEIEANWAQHQLIFSPQPSKGVDGKSTAALLSNTYNLVAAGVVGCVAAIGVFSPFVVREACGRLKVVKCCGKLEAVAAGVAGLGASVLLIAGFGLTRASQFRSEFVDGWNGLEVEMDNGGVAYAWAGDTAVMDLSLAAAVMALLGALMIVLRGTLCTGVNDEDYEEAEGDSLVKGPAGH
ncbi:hypothetical protein FNF31_05630 [Cafeteria roenbergensis]|nr:hypothetical protein FNF31_05630 [Cafeteria roenbergensis]